MFIKVHGPPGTGKTTYLMKQIEKYRKNSVDFKNMMFISFSNSAIDSIFNKIGVNIKSRSKGSKFYLFRTLHGICLSFVMSNKKLRNQLKKIFTQPKLIDSYYEYFCRKENIPYDDEINSDLIGNVAINLWTKIVSNYYPKKSLSECLDIMKIQNEDAYEVIIKWFKYKKEKKILDWNDILIYSYKNDINYKKLVKNDIKVAFVDEAQDFNKLEYKVLLKLIKGIDTVYFAGDVNQSIYTFKGVNPRLFYYLPSSKNIELKKTYRLPPEVLEFSYKILKKIKLKYIVKMTPTEKKGFVKFIDKKIDENSLINMIIKIYKKYKKPIFVLFRTTSIMSKIYEFFLKHKIIVGKLRSNNFYKYKFKKLFEISKKIKKGVKLSKDEYEFLISKLPIKSKEKKEKLMKRYNPLLIKKISKIGLGTVMEHSRDKEISMYMKKSLIPYKKYIIKDILNNADEYVLIDKICFGTFHSSKGLESDYVIVVDSITSNIKKKIENNEDDDIDDELRALYVACTRSKIGLVVCCLKGYDGIFYDYVKL